MRTGIMDVSVTVDYQVIHLYGQSSGCSLNNGTRIT